jgi:hypothetical protein
MSSVVYKEDMPRIIFIIAFVLIVLGFYVRNPTLNMISSELKGWGTIIATTAVAFGTISILKHHIGRVVKRAEGYLFSLWTIFVIIAMIIIGQGLGVDSYLYQFIFRNWYSPLYATVYSLIACYCISAIYRGFRFRNLGAVLMAIAFILTMLGEAPVGSLIWPGWIPIATWIRRVPLASAMRGIFIGATLTLMALAIRILQGREKLPLGISGEGGSE